MLPKPGELFKLHYRATDNTRSPYYIFWNYLSGMPEQFSKLGPFLLLKLPTNNLSILSPNVELYKKENFIYLKLLDKDKVAVIGFQYPNNSSFTFEVIK